MKKVFPLLNTAICLALLFSISCHSSVTKDQIATDTISIVRGQALFQADCSGCHGFLHDGIGPDLSGITQKESAPWLRQFIRSPKSMIDSGDKHAKKLLADYHTLMPSFTGFKDEETDQLIAFLHAQKSHTKKKEDPNAIKNPIPEKIGSSGIEIGLELMNQIPPSSDKQPLTRISKMDWVASAKSWFILDQRGKLYKQENQKQSVWLDIIKWKPAFINQPGLATGFGSFAFHPGFAGNGIFYTTHCEAPHSKKADFALADSVKQTLQWVLCEWKRTSPDADTFTGTCRELMRIDMVSGIHGVQEIIFNPAARRGDEDYGLLYIGVGDGGSVENGYAFLTQHPSHIWGTILRIDPLGTNSKNGQYGIPGQNPFAKTRDGSVVREIYAFGFRNPNRITFTTKGQMLATNIGQANIEAIDIVLKGHDYGWPIREGRFAMHPLGDINNIYPLPSNDSIFHITYPVASFDHDEGNAIAGGFEYTGRAMPALRGKYLFGDIPTGRLFLINSADLEPGKTPVVKEWFISFHGKRMTLRELCTQNRVDLRFARDEKGEMYLFTKPDGKIYRLSEIH